MAKKPLDKNAAARAVAEIRARREADRLRWAQQAERMAARGRAIDAEQRRPTGGSIPEIPKAPPAKAGSVLEVRHTREGGRGITYERKAVLCGKKGCSRLHGPYWYAFWSAGGRVRSVYIGKTFRTVQDKCPERLKGVSSEPV